MDKIKECNHADCGKICRNKIDKLKSDKKKKSANGKIINKK